MNGVVGYGVPEENIITQENVTSGELRSLISTMNTKGVTTLHVYVGSHGYQDMITFERDILATTAIDFAAILAGSTASSLHVTIDACNSGSLINELQSTLGTRLSSIATSTDADSSSWAWAWEIPYLPIDFGYSFFTDELTDFMEDPESDSNADGHVDYFEGVNRVLHDGGFFANLGKPQITSGSASIPTLSQWKQIFLTLLMLSLVMGFVGNQSPKLCMGNVGIMHCARISRLIVLDRQLFPTVMQWVGASVVLGLAGATLLFGSVSMLDIVGTLFCAPLVAYIVHLVVLAVGEYSGDQR